MRPNTPSIKKPASLLKKGLPDLVMYLKTRKVGSSRRRGRNASNAWAAATLRALAARRRQAAA